MRSIILFEQLRLPGGGVCRGAGVGRGGEVAAGALERAEGVSSEEEAGRCKPAMGTFCVLGSETPWKAPSLDVCLFG